MADTRAAKRRGTLDARESGITRFNEFIVNDVGPVTKAELRRLHSVYKSAFKKERRWINRAIAGTHTPKTRADRNPKRACASNPERLISGKWTTAKVRSFKGRVQVKINPTRELTMRHSKGLGYYFVDANGKQVSVWGQRYFRTKAEATKYWR